MTLSRKLADFREAIKQNYIVLAKENGFKGSKGVYILPTFDFCAETGARLGSSTIDEVKAYASRNVEFIYNSNIEGEYDDFSNFTVEELVEFYDALEKYIDNVENENK